MPRAPTPTKRRPARTRGDKLLPYTDAFGDWEVGEDGIRTCWRTAADTANDLDITTRRLQQLEDKGMPCRGHRATCRYPWPHAMVWWIAYRGALARHERVAEIKIGDAMDAYMIQNAVEDAEITNRMRRDPEYRARMMAAGV
jgi:hypothetical protein